MTLTSDVELDLRPLSAPIVPDRRAGESREVRLARFAAANGLSYRRSRAGSPVDGGLFSGTYAARTLRHFAGTLGGLEVEVGNHRALTRRGVPWSDVRTGYVLARIPSALPGLAGAAPELGPKRESVPERLPAPSAVPAAYVERVGATVIAHTPDPFDFARTTDWYLVEALLRHVVSLAAV